MQYNRIFWSGELVAYINNKRWHVDKYGRCIYRYTTMLLWLLTFYIYLLTEFYRFFCPFARGKRGIFFLLNNFYEVTKLFWCALLCSSAKSGWWTGILINAHFKLNMRVQWLPKTAKNIYVYIKIKNCYLKRRPRCDFHRDDGDCRRAHVTTVSRSVILIIARISTVHCGLLTVTLSLV